MNNNRKDPIFFGAQAPPTLVDPVDPRIKTEKIWLPEIWYMVEFKYDTDDIGAVDGPVEFVAYEILGLEEEMPEKSIVDKVETARGLVRSDRCSFVSPFNGTTHFCGRRGIEQYSKMLLAVFDFATDKMGMPFDEKDKS